MLDTITRVGQDTGTDVDADDGSDYDGDWFCIRTSPWPCGGTDCTFVADFVTAMHVIIVWPAIDDRWLLTIAKNCQDLKRNPSIVPYESGFGRAVSFDRWRSVGRPVHGLGPIPPNWAPRKL